MAAFGPCLSVVGYTVQRVWKHFMSVKTGHLLSLIYYSISKSDIQLICFKHSNKRFFFSSIFSHCEHLPSTGNFQSMFSVFVLSKRIVAMHMEKFQTLLSFPHFVIFETHHQCIIEWHSSIDTLFSTRTINFLARKAVIHVIQIEAKDEWNLFYVSYVDIVFFVFLQGYGTMFLSFHTPRLNNVVWDLTLDRGCNCLSKYHREGIWSVLDLFCCITNTNIQLGVIKNYL